MDVFGSKKKKKKKSLKKTQGIVVFLAKYKIPQKLHGVTQPAIAYKKMMHCL